MHDRFWKASPWFDTPSFAAYRHGRFIVVELTEAHRVMTTSACVGGVTDAVRHLVNHQSCEGAGHTERAAAITDLGLDGYHDQTCGELGLAPATTAVMGTAANMIYAAHETSTFGEARVDAIVTAGVEGNAACAGDPAHYVEGPGGWTKLPHVAGTINMIVTVNQPLKPEAQVRGLLTITEAKSAALAELSVPSLYSQNLATGTGTDQICFASPVGAGGYAYTSTSPHVKLGELLGDAVRSATKQALRWQNGLEPSFTRSLIHALKRFGFSDNAFSDAMRARLDESALRLIEKNRNSVLYEPQAAAAAYAIAAVLDRVRFGVIPPSAAKDVLRQQAASLAASLAAQIDNWPVFWRGLQVKLERPLDVVYDAIAMGWAAKWNTRD